jgi:dihydroorotate dehydrogenase
LRVPYIWNLFNINNSVGNKSLETKLFGDFYPSPLGLAAGFDKDCKTLNNVLKLGFGFVTGGTVTLTSRPGNPKPRMIRITKDKAIINALGFPGKGVEYSVQNLKRNKSVKNRIILSVSGTIEDEIVECIKLSKDFISAFEINISSPNTSGLKVFQKPSRLRGLIDLIKKHTEKPIIIKFPPWNNSFDNKKEIIKLIETSLNSNVEGMVISNTHPKESKKIKIGKGGYSGEPIFPHTLKMIREVQAINNGSADIIACGGISSSEDLWKVLASGAKAGQIYTSLVYQGPKLPSKINNGLIKLMEIAGIKKINDINGDPPKL